MSPHLEIVHTGFETFPWQAAIDGWYLRTTKGKIRQFSTDTACHRALRREVARRGLGWCTPYEWHQKAADIAANL